MALTKQIIAEALQQQYKSPLENIVVEESTLLEAYPDTDEYAYFIRKNLEDVVGRVWKCSFKRSSVTGGTVPFQHFLFEPIQEAWWKPNGADVVRSERKES